MRITLRNCGCPKQAIESLFYIKNHSNDDTKFQEQCQEMINILFEKFPGLMPLPSRSLTEQGNDVTGYISLAIRS